MNILGKKAYKVTVAANYVQVSCSPLEHGFGVRGKIETVSKRSMARLLKFINSVEFKRAGFVTLTYHENLKDEKIAYRDLRLWHKNLVYNFGAFCAVWKKEYQKRGAIHYHTFIFDPPMGMGFEQLRGYWLDAAGMAGDVAARNHAVDLKVYDVLDGDNGAVIVSYMAKYGAKAGENSGGKAWGILGRKNVKIRAVDASLDFADAESLLYSVLDAGGSFGNIDGGGWYARLYLGRIGGGEFENAQNIVKSILPAVNFSDGQGASANG